jgi:hypothetical protein
MGESAKDLVKQLSEASHEDAARILAEENAGEARSSVVDAAVERLDQLDGMPPVEKGEERPEVRRDPHGRILYPWETDASDY